MSVVSLRDEISQLTENVKTAHKRIERLLDEVQALSLRVYMLEHPQLEQVGLTRQPKDVTSIRRVPVHLTTPSIEHVYCGAAWTQATKHVDDVTCGACLRIYENEARVQAQEKEQPMRPTVRMEGIIVHLRNGYGSQSVYCGNDHWTIARAEEQYVSCTDCIRAYQREQVGP